MAQVIIDFHLDENKISENAEKEAGRQIASKIIDKAFGTSYNKDVLMARYVETVIREMLEPKKDEIIKEAVKEVVANLHRTKAVKEMLDNASKGS